MESSKTRIFYLRDKTNFPVACVASTVVDTQVGEETQPQLHYGVSTHNPLDVYNKALARKMATIRLNSQSLPAKFGGVVACPDAKQAKETLLKAIKENTSVAQRARDAAKLWLKRQEDQKTVTQFYDQHQST